MQALNLIVVILGMTAANLAFGGSLDYWYNSDSCEGDPTGKIIITLLEDKTICRSLVVVDYPSRWHGRIWSIAVDGKCMNTPDYSSAQDYCDERVIPMPGD